jgi:hypothetical protein
MNKILTSVVVILTSIVCTKAQHTLGMYPGAPNPTGSGITTASQVITLASNVNNPTDNVQSPYTGGTPAGLTVTYSLSNQQYAPGSIPNNPTVAGTVFGANLATTSNMYTTGYCNGTGSSQ